MFIIEKSNKTINYLFKKQEFLSHLLNLKDGFYEFLLKKIQNDRSLRQNRYYWGVIIKSVSDYTGYFPDEIHNFFKNEFLRDESGKIPRIKSTSRLSTSEFEEYLSRIRTFCSERIGITIPLPNETGGAFNYDIPEQTEKGGNNEF